MNQKGISATIIIIATAVVIVTAAIAYGFFILSQSPSPQEQPTQTTVPLTQQDPLQSKVGTLECPEVDYSGCDTSGNFMTWEDDGLR